MTIKGEKRSAGEHNKAKSDVRTRHKERNIKKKRGQKKKIMKLP